MKLRNKLTNSVLDVHIDTPWGDSIRVINEDNHTDFCHYDTLAELVSEWEDARKEPLIEDENIRKAVRAWFEANEISYKDVLRVRRTNSEVWSIVHEESYGREIIIEFFGNEPGDNILSEKPYHINELCGNEDK